MLALRPSDGLGMARTWIPLRSSDPAAPIARRLPTLRARDRAARDGRGRRAGHRAPGPPDRRGRHGVGKSFAYLVPAILAAVEQKQEGRRLDAHDRLQEQLLRKDIPFLRSVMPQEFSAVLVKGRSNYISLRRLDVARQRGRCAPSRRHEEFDQLAEIRLWAEPDRATAAAPTSTSGRSPASGTRSQSENGNCLGRDCPRHKDCFYFKARRRMLDGQPPDRQPRPVLQRPGPAGRRASGCCPTTTWRSSTRPTRSRRWPASTWACSSRASASTTRWRGSTTSGPARGCWSIHQLARGHRAGAARPAWRPTTSSTRSRDWHQRPAAGFNGRVRKPIGWPEHARRGAAQAGHGDRRGRRRRREAGASGSS